MGVPLRRASLPTHGGVGGGAVGEEGTSADPVAVLGQVQGGGGFVATGTSGRRRRRLGEAWRPGWVDAPEYPNAAFNDEIIT